MSEALLVAIGAVPGAWLRFHLLYHFEPMLPRRHWGTFGINLFACLALGLLAGLESHGGADAHRVLLLLGTGFLGSFSTFSTFIGELRVVLLQRHWREAALLVAGSVAGGLVAVMAGLALAGLP